jgi:hypothetical protein
MNIDSHKKQTKYRVDIVAGFVLALFVSIGFISQLHSPWTCKQSKDNWQKQPINQSHQNSQQVKHRIVNRDTIHLCF